MTARTVSRRRTPPASAFLSDFGSFYYWDSYEAPLRRGDLAMHEIHLALFAHHPRWARWLLILRGFTRAGNTMLNAPPGAKAAARGSSITLEKTELEKLNDLWRDVNNLIGRRNLGVRLFNVSSMLSNAIEAGRI